MFQANTNASLKNLETQVWKLALNMQNQSRDSFPSDTKKNPKDYMAITPRSCKELQERKEARRNQKNYETRSKYKIPTGSKKGQSINELSDDSQLLKEQGEMT